MIILLNRPLIVKPLNVTHYKYLIKFKPELYYSLIFKLSVTQNHCEVFSIV